MAARYAYECPECNSAIELSTTQAGQELQCDSCNANVVAPKLGVIKSLQRVDGGGVPSKKTPKSAKTGSPLKRWLFTGGLLLAVLGGIAGAAAQYRANQFYAPVDIEAAIDAEFKTIDQAPATEIYGALVGSTAEDFTLEYSEAPYRTLNIKNKIIQWVAWSCFGVAGFGVLLLLSSFLLRK